jgi:uncharacterized protein YkwD
MFDFDCVAAAHSAAWQEMRCLSKGLVTVMRFGWLFVALVMLAGLVSAEARETYVAFAQRLVTQEQANATFRPDLESVVAAKVNSYRRGQGVAALKVSAGLLVAARAHAMDLAIHGEMGHTSSTGMGFDSRMHAFRDGAMFLPSMGENAARERSRGPPDAGKAARMVVQWIKSSGHRHNLVNRSYVAVATGVVQKGDQLYAVQIFVGPEVKSNARRGGAGASVY